MPGNMTAEQKDLMLFVIRSGMACGLSDVDDCVLNYENHLTQLYPYTDVPDKEKELYAALCEFYKGTASCPEEDAELAKLTPETSEYFFARRVAARRAEYERRIAMEVENARHKEG